MKNALTVITIAILLAAAVFYYNKYNESQKLLKNPQEASKTEVQSLTNMVGKLIVLPKDEQPTVATVTDSKKLKDQSFFAKAQNGDKALLYIKTKKAILYRPSTNKIIEVAPINLTQQDKPGAKVSPTQAAPSKAISPTSVSQQ